MYIYIDTYLYIYVYTQTRLKGAIRCRKTILMLSGVFCAASLISFVQGEEVAEGCKRRCYKCSGVGNIHEYVYI